MKDTSQSQQSPHLTQTAPLSSSFPFEEMVERIRQEKIQEAEAEHKKLLEEFNEIYSFNLWVDESKENYFYVDKNKSSIHSNFFFSSLLLSLIFLLILLLGQFILQIVTETFWIFFWISFPVFLISSIIPSIHYLFSSINIGGKLKSGFKFDEAAIKNFERIGFTGADRCHEIQMSLQTLQTLLSSDAKIKLLEDYLTERITLVEEKFFGAKFFENQRVRCDEVIEKQKRIVEQLKGVQANTLLAESFLKEYEIERGVIDTKEKEIRTYVDQIKSHKIQAVSLYEMYLLRQEREENLKILAQNLEVHSIHPDLVESINKQFEEFIQQSRIWLEARNEDSLYQTVLKSKDFSLLAGKQKSE